MNSIVQTKANSPIILIRISAGLIFLSEGIQKYLLPESVGSGRFEKIGILMPNLIAGFVGFVEIICGVMILIGLATRLATIPLMSIMLVAIYMTKFPIFFESGFWKMAHESRTDFSMLISLIFLFIAGSGRYSLDLKLWENKNGFKS